MSNDFGIFFGIGLLVFFCYLGGGVNTYLSQMNDCKKVEEVKK